MQKEPKQKRSEVPDEKLDKLIEEYGNCRANEATAKCLAQQGSFSAQKGIIIARTNGAKVKQAIIDYHDKKIQEATKEIAKRKRLNENCPICESPLEDNGVCSDVGGNNCQYLKGVE